MAVAAAAAIGGGLMERRYRRHLRAAEQRLASADRSGVATEFGQIEYADVGVGSPVLVSHGIFHGFDGGLLSVEGLLADHRVIAPSRFGYPGSDMPPSATVADQADAFAALLDQLGLATATVVGISAGTGAAVQFALRHGDRADHLILSSGSFPGSPTAQAPPRWARRFYADRPMWAAKVLAGPAFAQLMGVPRGFPRDDDQTREVERLTNSIFPIGPRTTGALFDAYVSNPEIGEYPLEQIGVPTLIVHAADDPLASHDAAVAAAERIPGAILVTLESGGHFQLGQTEKVRTAIASFLTQPATG